MVHESSHNDDLFVPLDAGAGPAMPLTGERAEALARAVVRRVRGHKPHRWLRLSRPLQMAAAAAMALTIAGAAAAAVRYFAPPKPKEVPPSAPQAADCPPAETPPTRVRKAKRPAKVVEPEKVAVTPVEVAFNPGAMLRDANRWRAEGRYERAAHLYSQVAKKAKGQDAYVAMIAAAGLQIDHLNSPREALRLYRHALRVMPRGPLSATARFGIAASLRALGNRDAEISALQDFLEHHPSDPQHLRAEARLSELQ